MAHYTIIEFVYRSHERDSIQVPSSWVSATAVGVTIRDRGDVSEEGLLSEFFPWDSVKSIRRYRT